MSTATFALRELRHQMTLYRRTWRGTLFSSVVNPLLYLAALGAGLGSMVNHHAASRLGGVSYLMFIAPGLLAASAMQIALGAATYPVLGGVKWQKTYFAAVATPMRPADIFHGFLLFITIRLTIAATAFLAVMSVFGAVRTPLAAAAMPVAVLTGLAFAAPVAAWAATRDGDMGFALLFRLGMIPMFLFSATFFPLSQLPAWLRPVAYVTPLWHGVAACRALSLGDVSAPGLIAHVGYLAALAVAGVLVGQRTYRRRLHG
ncbi:MAG TPA: ABC transporter permease [Streptosporangiaceae bacterium]|nr:ABC transporter permease [Streptosporangiaceae bacterium]